MVTIGTLMQRDGPEAFDCYTKSLGRLIRITVEILSRIDDGFYPVRETLKKPLFIEIVSL